MVHTAAVVGAAPCLLSLTRLAIETRKLSLDLGVLDYNCALGQDIATDSSASSAGYGTNFGAICHLFQLLKGVSFSHACNPTVLVVLLRHGGLWSSEGIGGDVS